MSSGDGTLVIRDNKGKAVMTLNIILSASDANVLANALKYYQNSVYTNLKTLDRTVNTLRNSWKGEAHNTFIAEYNDWEVSMRKLIELMGQVSSTAKNVGNKMMEEKP